jgi:hypothetical protein
MNEGWCRLWEVVVGVVGVRAGVVPILSKAFGEGKPTWLAFPNYLDAPWCYVVAAGVIAVAFAVLVVLDERRKKAPPMKGS